MGIYKTAVSKELKIRIEKIQDNLSNVKGRPQYLRDRAELKTGLAVDIPEVSFSNAPNISLIPLLPI
jgi:hypothetical protein